MHAGKLQNAQLWQIRPTVHHSSKMILSFYRVTLCYHRHCYRNSVRLSVRPCVTHVRQDWRKDHSAFKGSQSQILNFLCIRFSTVLPVHTSKMVTDSYSGEHLISHPWESAATFLAPPPAVPKIGGFGPPNFEFSELRQRNFIKLLPHVGHAQTTPHSILEFKFKVKVRFQGQNSFSAIISPKCGL